ncbi:MULTISPECIES: hypothetical protein [Methylomonas]|uniref:hypothetical protein n=1 Tax=Methylomonas TaxID=416 RepID=UPI001232657D|nr:hypothetical protein [Methylomonas rhizoryzae]
MKRFHGLQDFAAQTAGPLGYRALADWLLPRLAKAYCDIFGSLNDTPILLAHLALIPETLDYDAFDQRADFIVGGAILRNDCVPLTYRLAAGEFGISGRCSMIGKVCGVDLYLQRSYTGTVGDIARQKFSVDLKTLLAQTKQLQR